MWQQSCEPRLTDYINGQANIKSTIKTQKEARRLKNIVGKPQEYLEGKDMERQDHVLHW